MRLDITVRNPSAATHPGGTWDLGDPGSLMLERLTLTIPLTGVSAIHYAAEPGAAFTAASAPLEIYQDSSGGEAWHSNVHLNRHREIATKFRGYRVTRGGASANEAETGLRASPVVTVQTQAGEISAAIADFWQNFPKAIEVTSDALLLHLFPPQTEGGHELQAGEQKTHTLFVSIARQRRPRPRRLRAASPVSSGRSPPPSVIRRPSTTPARA